MDEVVTNFKPSKQPKKARRTWPSPADMGRERCEIGMDGCMLRATESHHIKLRSRGGSDDPSNLIASCQRCHSWIHHNVELATEKGWMSHAWS